MVRQLRVRRSDNRTQAAVMSLRRYLVGQARALGMSEWEMLLKGVLGKFER
jgi:hypothetical protein